MQIVEILVLKTVETDDVTWRIWLLPEVTVFVMGHTVVVVRILINCQLDVLVVSDFNLHFCSDHFLG